MGYERDDGEQQYKGHTPFWNVSWDHLIIERIDIIITDNAHKQARLVVVSGQFLKGRDTGA